MSEFSVTILGSNSSIPTLKRGLTSQIISVSGQLYMIDCGEGTQLQLAKFGIRRMKIKSIFISHLHGDHLYGLPGLISSYTHFGRKEELKVFGPPGIKKYLNVVFEVSQVHLSFEIKIFECNQSETGLIFEDEYCKVFNYSLSHRITAQGFVFIEKIVPYRIDPQKISEHKLNIDQIKKIKSGVDIRIDDIIYNPQTFCKPKLDPRKYVFASDTSPLNEFPEIIMNPDLIYHETTYLHELEVLALERGHSTTVHAANIAKSINAKKLLIGHFSSRYKETEILKQESQVIFQNTELSYDGKVVEL